MSDVLGNFITPMVALYGEPESEDKELVFEFYRKTLAGYRDVDLKAGFEKVAGSYVPTRRSPLPPPAVCKKACEEAAQERIKTEDSQAPQMDFAPVRRGPYDAATLKRWELAAQWRQKVIAEHGSVDAYLLKYRPAQKGAA